MFQHKAINAYKLQQSIQGLRREWNWVVSCIPRQTLTSGWQSPFYCMLGEPQRHSVSGGEKKKKILWPDGNPASVVQPLLVTLLPLHYLDEKLNIYWYPNSNCIVL